ncbi:MAG: hypothetical protein V4724_34880 [Pseudomonadota bacterium]
MTQTISDFPGTINDALRYLFIRHHLRHDRMRDLLAQAASQDELQERIDQWIIEEWNKKHADLADDFSMPAILSVFRRDLMRGGEWLQVQDEVRAIEAVPA